MKTHARCRGFSSLIILLITIGDVSAGWTDDCKMEILIPVDAKLNKTHESNYFNCVDLPQMVKHWCNLFTHHQTAYYRTIIDRPNMEVITNWEMCPPNKPDNSLMVYHVVYAGFCVALLCLGVYPCLFSTKSKWQCKREATIATIARLDRDRNAAENVQVQPNKTPAAAAVAVPKVPTIQFTLNDIEQQNR